MTDIANMRTPTPGQAASAAQLDVLAAKALSEALTFWSCAQRLRTGLTPAERPPGHAALFVAWAAAFVALQIGTTPHLDRAKALSEARLREAAE